MARKAAKGVTGEEVYDVLLGPFKTFMEETVQARPKVFPKGMKSAYLFMDKSPPHTRAETLGLVKALGCNRVQHPPLSYDYQLPIEWPNSLWKKAAARVLQGRRGLTGVAKIKRTLKSLWEGTLPGYAGADALFTPKRVMAMIRRQQDVYRQVLANDGGYAKKKDS